VLLPDPTVVILSPDRATEMCDGGRSALAILGAGSGKEGQSQQIHLSFSNSIQKNTPTVTNYSITYP
jgi:hypothetical protein